MEFILLGCLIILCALTYFNIRQQEEEVKELQMMYDRIVELEHEVDVLEHKLKQHEGKDLENYSYLNSRLNKMALENINK